MPRDLDGPAIHATIAASPDWRRALVENFNRHRFLCGLIGGCYFTVGAAFVWSFFL